MSESTSNPSPGVILTALFENLKKRKLANPETSYVASLYEQGLPKITRKVMEEAFEAVQAAYHLEINPQEQSLKTALTNEFADLWFHTLVMACACGVELTDITNELQKRMGTSGITEKQNRKKK